MRKPIYVGGGKRRKDNWRTVTVNMDKAEEYIEEFKGTRILKLSVSDKDEPDQYGKDVSLVIDQYKPPQ